MKKYLVIGDFHIPRRARDLAHPFYEVIDREAPEGVLCTGDLIGEEVLTILGALADEVHVVAGNMDHLELPPNLVVEEEGWRIGLVHGSGIIPRGDPEQLGKVALSLDADLLAHGHTHEDSAYRRVFGGRHIVFVNPGSATGIGGGSGGTLEPSLAMLSLSPGEVDVTRYRLGGSGMERVRDVFPR
jgi:putative phosphoesterase